ncbi:hypothetical protein ACVWZ8_001289 [Arthrobacter sp. UYCu723]
MLTTAELLAAHDQQVRGGIATRLPGSWDFDWDGPLLRVTTPVRGLAFAQDLDALSVDELDALIRRLGTYLQSAARPSSGRRTAMTVRT